MPADPSPASQKRGATPSGDANVVHLAQRHEERRQSRQRDVNFEGLARAREALAEHRPDWRSGA